MPTKLTTHTYRVAFRDTGKTNVVRAAYIQVGGGSTITQGSRADMEGFVVFKNMEHQIVYAAPVDLVSRIWDVDEFDQE